MCLCCVFPSAFVYIFYDIEKDLPQANLLFHWALTFRPIVDLISNPGWYLLTVRCRSTVTVKAHSRRATFRHVNVKTLRWRAKWVCNPFCPSLCPSKRSKVPPVNITLTLTWQWRSVWTNLKGRSSIQFECFASLAFKEAWACYKIGL